MDLSYVNLDEVERWPRNAKLHNDEGIQASINRFGFVAPLIRDTTSGRLVAGHGRLENLQAMKAEGQSAPSNIRTGASGEWLVPVVSNAFNSEAEAEAYLLADNRLTEMGGWDEAKLQEIFAGLSSCGDIDTALEGVGFTVEEVLASATQVVDVGVFGDQAIHHSNPNEDSYRPLNTTGTNGDNDRNVRMVQLFLNSETQPLFLDAVRGLSGTLGTDNLTDTVFQAVLDLHRRISQDIEPADQ